MKVKVLELKGVASLRVMNVFNKLMIGLMMLPAYITEKPEAFLARVQAMPPEDQRKIIENAVENIDLFDEEVEAVLKFAADPNGLPIDKTNVGNFGPHELKVALTDVLFAYSQLKVDLVTDSEKKKS